MKNKQFSENVGGGRKAYPSPEIRVFTLGVEAGFCQSNEQQPEGQIGDVKYLDIVEW